MDALSIGGVWLAFPRVNSREISAFGELQREIRRNLRHDVEVNR